MDISLVGSLLSALAGLYGLLFGFTFIILQLYLRDLPLWMTRCILKSIYFIIFILLYPFSLILYPLSILEIPYPYLAQIDISPSVLITVFSFLFIVDVFYTPLYILGMLLKLHPEHFLVIVKKEIEKGKKQHSHLNNVYSGVVSLMRKYDAELPLIESLNDKINEVYETIGCPEQVKVFTIALREKFIIPLLNHLVDEGKAGYLERVVWMIRQIAEKMIEQHLRDEFDRILGLYGSLFLGLHKSDIKEKDEIKRFIKMSCEYLKGKAPQEIQPQINVAIEYMEKINEH